MYEKDVINLKKVSIILITLFAVIGALLIYHYVDNKQVKTNINEKITNEYNLVTDSIIEYKTIDEVNNILNNGTGVIFFCITENEWCNYYAKYLNDISVKNEIKNIFYLNIKQDRKYNTSGYRKIVNRLKDYLLKDDENEIKLFVPTVIFVKNGKVIGYDSRTSIITKNISPSEYWNEENIIDFNEKITNIISNYKEVI